MILNVGSKEVVRVTDDKNNFSIDRVELKERLGVSSFSDLSERHFNFLLNHDVTEKANDSLAGHIENQFFYDEWPEDFEKYLISKLTSDEDLLNGSAKKYFPTNTPEEKSSGTLFLRSQTLDCIRMSQLTEFMTTMGGTKQ